MASIFKSHFEPALSGLLDYFADETPITYTDRAGSVVNLRAILGDVQVTEVEHADGTIVKEYRRSIHIPRETDCHLRIGVDDPKVRGRFLIGGQQWSIEDRETQAIQGKTESFVTLSLVRKNPTNKARPSTRDYR